MIGPVGGHAEREQMAPTEVAAKNEVAHGVAAGDEVAHGVGVGDVERAPLHYIQGRRWSPGVYRSLRLLGKPLQVAWERAFITLPTF